MVNSENIPWYLLWENRAGKSKCTLHKNKKPHTFWESELIGLASTEPPRSYLIRKATTACLAPSLNNYQKELSQMTQKQEYSSWTRQLWYNKEYFLIRKKLQGELFCFLMRQRQHTFQTEKGFGEQGLKFAVSLGWQQMMKVVDLTAACQHQKN